MAAFIDTLGVGWNDGACFVLASGILQWVTQERVPHPSSDACYALVRGTLHSGFTTEMHIVVAVRVGVGRKQRLLYLDGEGVSEEWELLKHWDTEERVREAQIAPFEEEWLSRSETIQHQGVSDAIAKLLNQHFGTFAPRMLTVEPTWEWGGDLVIHIRQQPLGLNTVTTVLERLQYLHTCLWLMQQERPEALAAYQDSSPYSSQYAAQAPIAITHMEKSLEGMVIHVQVHSSGLANALLRAFTSCDLPVELSIPTGRTMARDTTRIRAYP